MNKPESTSTHTNQTIEPAKDIAHGSQRAHSLPTDPPACFDPTSFKLFPEKLHLMFIMPQYSDIICWLPHGRSWCILDQDRFKFEILPQFFQHSRMSSFTRLMQKWGFHCISRGNSSLPMMYYYHELFLRDAPELCHKMTKLTPKELANRQESDKKPPPLIHGTPIITKPKQYCADGTSMLSKPDRYKSYLEQKLLDCSQEQRAKLLSSELSLLEASKSHVLHQMQSCHLGDTSILNQALTMVRKDLPCPSGTWTVAQGLEKIMADYRQQQQIPNNPTKAVPTGSSRPPPSSTEQSLPRKNNQPQSTDFIQSTVSTEMDPWIRRATLEIISELQSKSSQHN